MCRKSPQGEELDDALNSPIVKQHPFSHTVSSDITFCYDLSAAPKKQKMMLLTVYGVAVEGFLTGNPERDKDIMAWYPLPDRDKELEEQLKKEGKLPWTKLAMTSR
jgi:hypothetical protein